MPTVWSINQLPHLWHPHLSGKAINCIHRLLDHQTSSARQRLQASRSCFVRLSSRCIKTRAQDGEPSAKRKQKPRCKKAVAPLFGAAALASKYQHLFQQNVTPANTNLTQPQPAVGSNAVISKEDNLSDGQSFQNDDVVDAAIRKTSTGKQPADFLVAQQTPEPNARVDVYPLPQIATVVVPPAVSITQLKKSYPWLLSDKGKMGPSEWDLRVEYATLLYNSLDLLVNYDISSLDGRAAPLQRNPAVIEPSLSVRLQARQEQELRAAANNALVTALFPEQLQPQPVLPLSGASKPGSIVQDGRWARRLAEHDSYLQYMQQLYNVLVPSNATSNQPTSKQKRNAKVQASVPETVTSTTGPGMPASETEGLHTSNLDPQLMYQVGICEDWIQLSHLLDTFLPYTGPGSITAVYKQLCSVLSQPRVSGWGPSERQAFSVFTARLAHRALALMSSMEPVEMCWVAYGAAVLESYQTGRPYDGLSVLPATYSFGADLIHSSHTKKEISGNIQNTSAVDDGPDSSQPTHTASQGSHSAVNLAYHPVVRDRITNVAALFYGLCSRAQLLIDSSAASSRSVSNKVGVRQSTAQDTADVTASIPQIAKAQSAASDRKVEAQQPASSDMPNLQLNEVDVSTADDGEAEQSRQQENKITASPQDTWTATQYSQLSWALGMIGYRPPPSLVRLMIRYTERRLERFQPSQQWALMWGMARLSGSPAFPKIPARWITRFYAASQRIIGDYDGEGLVHLVWSAAILRGTQQHVPDREWSRAVCGAAAAKSRTLTGPYIVALIEGLTLLGYVPRPEVSRVLLEQARRYLHTLTAEQLATLIKSTAVQTRWQPPRPFLYDWARSAGKLMRTFRPSYVAASLWSLATLGYTPEDAMWRAMLQAVAIRGFTMCTASDLSQTIWSIATLKAGYRLNKFYVESAVSYLPITSGSGSKSLGQQRKPISRDDEALSVLQDSEKFRYSDTAALTDQDTSTTPTNLATSTTAVSPTVQEAKLQGMFEQVPIVSGLSSESVVKGSREVLWLEGWLESAARSMDTFNAPDVAYSVWALGQIGAQPSEALIQLFLDRAEDLLPDMTTQELSCLVQGLALMRYRPCDAWLEAFVKHVEPRLPECGGPHIGYLAWSLASVGTPVTEDVLKAMARECSRQWASMTGDGLGHLAWALGQYSYSPYSKPPPEDPVVAEQRGLNPWQPQPSRKETQWWQGYYNTCGQKWVGTSSKALVLMLFGTAGVVRTPPPRDWQLELLRAIRMTVPRPEHEGDVLRALFQEAGLYGGGRVADIVDHDSEAQDRHKRSKALKDAGGGNSLQDMSHVHGSTTPQIQRDPVPLLDQDPYFQALVQQDPALRVLIPPRALNSLWLAVWLGELRVRWGFDRCPAVWVPGGTEALTD